MEDLRRVDTEWFEGYAKPFKRSLIGEIVLIEEEYGYRYWVWETGMARETLAEYFFNLDPEEFWGEMTKLPGKVHLADLGDDCWVVFDNDTQNTWYLLAQGVPRAHLHTREDSWLQLGERFIEPRCTVREPDGEDEVSEESNSSNGIGQPHGSEEL